MQIIQIKLHHYFKCLCLIGALFWLVSCQTGAKKVAAEKGEALRFDARALIVDKTKKKSQLVHLEGVTVEKKSQIRLDISTSLSISLASLVIRKDKMEALLPQQKKFMRTQLDAKAFLPLLGVEFAPELLNAALFNQEVPGWNCQRENENKKQILACQNPDATKAEIIRWDWLPEDQKTVHIENSDYQIQIQFKEQESLPTLKPGLFKLKIPKGYAQLESPLG